MFRVTHKQKSAVTQTFKSNQFYSRHIRPIFINRLRKLHVHIFELYLNKKRMKILRSVWDLLGSFWVEIN